MCPEQEPAPGRPAAGAAWPLESRVVAAGTGVLQSVPQA